MKIATVDREKGEKGEKKPQKGDGDSGKAVVRAGLGSWPVALPAEKERRKRRAQDLHRRYRKEKKNSNSLSQELLLLRDDSACPCDSHIRREEWFWTAGLWVDVHQRLRFWVCGVDPKEDDALPPYRGMTTQYTFASTATARHGPHGHWCTAGTSVRACVCASGWKRGRVCTPDHCESWPTPIHRRVLTSLNPGTPAAADVSQEAGLSRYRE